VCLYRWRRAIRAPAVAGGALYRGESGGIASVPAGTGVVKAMGLKVQLPETRRREPIARKQRDPRLNEKGDLLLGWGSATMLAR